ncbi:MAG: hypothetical protein LQ343_006572 [Gyalolechia ehrenbergii]|nr:MAG: hypothetical protein LQ343_006572 [Gyalolechia ehrenbergii]
MYTTAPKTKGQKMDLGTFLTDSSLGSWADEMEDMPMPASMPIAPIQVVDDTSEVETNVLQVPVRTTLPLPTKPPFTVHLGNMSFDSTEGDVHDFFGDCQVTSVRIVEDKIDRKPKGFGYAEFATLDGLKKALDLSGAQFQGRNIRISVAEPQKDRPDAREFNDWTRKGPLPDLPNQRRVTDRPGFGAPRSFDNVSEAGSDRGSRRPFEQGDGKVRDFGNWERKGPLQPAAPAPSGPPRPEMNRPMSRDGPSMRRNSPAWGEGRSQDGSRPPRREFVERPAIDRAPTAAEKDSQWRNNMRPDAPVPAPARSPAMSNRDSSTPSSPLAAPATLQTPAAPTVRPKLNLQKRTLTEPPSEAQITQPSDSKASPFGAAKPIDTAAKEKEIEEKRQAALKEKKEAEDKAREEKKVAEEKAREEQRLAKESEKAATPEKTILSKDKPNGVEPEKENGATGPPPGKNYEILRRQANEDTDAAEDEPEGAANGVITDDKAIKPQEIVRDMPDANGNSPGNSNSQVEPSAEALEEDGWSTVSKHQKTRKNPRSGNMPARAIAS